MMEWTDALRKYASMKGIKWRIYKKGTAEYAEIKKLQMEGGGAKKEESKTPIKDKMMARIAKKAESKTPIKDKMMARIAKSKEVREKPLEDASMFISNSGEMLIPHPGGYKSPSLHSKEALKKADKMMAKKMGKKVRKVRSDKGKKRGKICKEEKSEE